MNDRTMLIILAVVAGCVAPPPDITQNGSLDNDTGVRTDTSSAADIEDLPTAPNADRDPDTSSADVGRGDANDPIQCEASERPRDALLRYNFTVDPTNSSDSSKSLRLFRAPEGDIETSSDGAVAFDGTFRLESSGPVDETCNVEPSCEVSDAIKAAGAFSAEVWVRPDAQAQDDTAAYPRRIMDLTSDITRRSFTIGQASSPASRYDLIVRLQTSGPTQRVEFNISDNDGWRFRGGELAHVAMAWDQERLDVWVNGQLALSTLVPGDIETWRSEHLLVFGAAPDGTRGWVGNLHYAALYARALTEHEIRSSFCAGAPVR